MPNITVTMDAKDAGLWAQWQQAKKGPQEFAEELKRVSKAGKEAKDSVSGIASEAGRALAGFAGFGSVVAGIATTAAVLKAEYDNLLSRQKAAAGFQISLANAKGAAFTNARGVGVSGATMTAWANDISSKAGRAQGDVYNLLGGVMSGKGDASADFAKSVAGEVAGLRAVPSADMGLTAEAALGIAKRFGEGASPRQLVGSVIGLQGLSRGVSVRSAAEHGVPGMLGVGAFGGTMQGAMGLVSALSNLSEDREMARSKTASIQFASQIMEKTAGIPELAGKGWEERYDWMMAGSAAGESARMGLFGEGDDLGSITGETAQVPHMRELGRRGSKAYATFQEMRRKAPSLAAASELYEVTNRDIMADPLLRNAYAEANIQSTQQSLKASNIKGGKAGVFSAENLYNVMQDAGMGMMGATAEKWAFQAGLKGFDNEQAFQKSVSDRATILRRSVDPENQAIAEKLEMLVKQNEILIEQGARGEVRVVDNVPATQAERATPATAPVGGPGGTPGAP